jgi:hypothetical protein
LGDTSIEVDNKGIFWSLGGEFAGLLSTCSGIGSLDSAGKALECCLEGGMGIGASSVRYEGRRELIGIFSLEKRL